MTDLRSSGKVEQRFIRVGGVFVLAW